jgi:hypothetical protein
LSIRMVAGFAEVADRNIFGLRGADLNRRPLGYAI